MSNKAKGTQKTEAIIGTAATKLSAAVKGIQEAAQTASKLEEQLTDYNLRVTDLEGKIGGLEQEYANKKAQQEIDLGLSYKAAQRAFASKFLDENGMIAVVVEEDKKVRNELDTLKANYEKEVASKVAAATNSINTNIENKIKLLEAEYKAKEAQNIARIENLTSQLAFANEQAKLWKESLDAEREAGVKRSANSAVHQTIGTNNGK